MNNQYTKILLIDDETAIAEVITAYAQKEHMDISYAQRGEEGLALFEKEKFDIVLVDWMLPGLSGLEIIKAIRQKSLVPILMLSARNDESDIVLGLEFGADDYITKPFGPRELIARIHALLRRSGKPEQAPSSIKVKNLSISFTKKEVLKDGKKVELTPTELRILEELYEKKGEVVSREELMEEALGYHDFLNDRTLDTHIKNLRKKIEEAPKNPHIIITVREAGFKFNV